MINKETMKKIALISILTLGVMMPSKNTFANNTDKTSVKNQSSVQRFETNSMESTLYYNGYDQIKIGLFQEEVEKVKLQILSADGVVLFSAKYEEDTISDIFDISELPEGNFIIRITKGKEVIEKQFFKNKTSNDLEN
jgi:regulation of enolase protein 1 (concanavalin A-like superfamily)